jgi:hypothetical protein
MPGLTLLESLSLSPAVLQSNFGVKEMHPGPTMQVALLATVCTAQLIATSAQAAPVGEAALLEVPRERLTSPGFAGLPESARAAIMAARMHSMGFAPASAPAGALAHGGTVIACLSHLPAAVCWP